MPYYLAPYIGSGTFTDRFRPLGSDQPGWSAVDLRPDASRLDGGGLNACLLYLPVPNADAQLRQIGLAKGDSINQGLRNAIQARLGITVTATTLLQLVWDLLLTPPANSWRPIIPARNRLEVWLGPDPWLQAVIAGGASASDTFNRADEALTVGGGNWTKSPGSGASNAANVASNQVTTGVQEITFCYWNAATFTPDQDCSVRWISGDGIYPCVRIRTDAAGPSAYYAAFSNQAYITKVVDGGFTDIQTGADTPASGDIFRITIVGTSLTSYRNGVQKLTVTDSALAAGQPGLFTYNGTDDDWAAEDIGLKLMIRPRTYRPRPFAPGLAR